MAKNCSQCGNAITENDAFCPGCGAPTEKGAGEKGAASLMTALSEIGETIAPESPGESLLGSFGGADAAADVIEGPFKTVISGMTSLCKNVVGLFKEKRVGRIVAAGVIALVWLALMLLSRFGKGVGILNFLTFARGGMGRTVPGALGGLLGKATVAAAVFSAFTGGAKNFTGGFKTLTCAPNFQTRNLGALLSGAGAALLVYQFFAGSAVISDAMSALSGAFLSVAALGGKSGFLFKLAQSLTAKKTEGTLAPQGEKASALLSGAAFGFTLGALLSFIPFGWTPAILGGACFIAGTVLSIVSGKGKEAAKA